MNVITLPDAEKLVSRFLRDQTEINALVSQRVYTEIPANPTWPLLLARRVGGTTLNRPRYVDYPLMQLDAYGGSKAEAHDLLETALGVIAARIQAVHALGTVSWVDFGQFSWLPDTDYTPARPRYVGDFTLTLHP